MFYYLLYLVIGVQVHIPDFRVRNTKPKKHEKAEFQSQL